MSGRVISLDRTESPSKVAPRVGAIPRPSAGYWARVNHRQSTRHMERTPEMGRMSAAGIRRPFDLLGRPVLIAAGDR
jgi:hypothetical protein